MKNQPCCQNPEVESLTVDASENSKTKFHEGRFREIMKLVLPGAILALLPKCPLCFAAYFALLTGFGIPLTTAGFLRLSLVVLCSAAILYFAFKHLKRVVRFNGFETALAGKIFNK